MTVSVRFRDIFAKFTPPWLADRGKDVTQQTVGYRYLWSMIAPLDAAMDVLVQGLQAAWPGKGTSTALPYIGRSRGIVRGPTETDASFAFRLIQWLDTWRGAGSALTIARTLHDYLTGNPKVRVITRSGVWVTVNADGSVTYNNAAWNWDGTSHPTRSGYWSEIWIVIYPSPYATAGQFLDVAGTPAPLWGDQLGIGHDVPRSDYDAVKGLIAQWKAAHTKVRAVIWTSDATLFDPTNPATCPNGNWGAWGNTGAGSRVASSRNTTTCRYWEP